MVHGYGGYVRGCRCDVCKTGTREYQREYRKRPKDPKKVKHGLSGYTNYKCRCEVCRAANSAYQAKHHERNKDELLAKSAERYARNPERYLDRNERRRARLLGQCVENVERRVVLKRANYKCEICGDPIVGRWEMDHIVQLAHGGEHSYANVRAAHISCNRKRSRKPQ